MPIFTLLAAPLASFAEGALLGATVYLTSRGVGSMPFGKKE